jgi:hypothetical protein
MSTSPRSVNSNRRFHSNRGWARVWHIIAVLAVIVAAGGFKPASTQAASPLTVRVVIERIQGLDCMDETPFGCGSAPDFYAFISIDGAEIRTPSRGSIGDKSNIQPGWEHSWEVDPAKGTIPIMVEVRDADGGLRGNDDHVDLTPGSAKNLSLSVNLRSCAVGGDISGSCWTSLTSKGTNNDRAQIWIRIDVNLPRTPFWGHIYDGAPPDRARPIAGHRVAIVDDATNEVLDSQATADDGQFAFDIRVPADTPLRLQIDDCPSVSPVTCTFFDPFIAQVDIPPIGHDQRSARFPGCQAGATCRYAPVDFFFRRTGTIGPIALTTAVPKAGVSRFVLRDNPLMATDPVVTLQGQNLHTWIKVWLYQADCATFPNCERHLAEVIDRAPDLSWIKVQMPALPSPTGFSAGWFWAVQDVFPRVGHVEWAKLSSFFPAYPKVHGFQFVNKADSPTLGEFDGAFGDNAYICIGAFGVCAFKVRDPLYLLYYGTIYQLVAGGSGSCVGMAATSLLTALGHIKPESWEADVHYAAGFSGVPDPNDPMTLLPPKPAKYHNPISGPQEARNLWALIRSNHGVQASGEFVLRELSQMGFNGISVRGNPNARLEELRARPLGNVLCMVPSLGSGHCVTPYALEDVNATTSRIWIYDNNAPNDADRYLVVDRSANRYDYPLDPRYQGTGLYTIPESVWRGERHAPLLLPEARRILLSVVFGNADGLYTTPDGGSWGWRRDGSFVDALPGAVALPSLGQSDSETRNIPLALPMDLPAPNVAINTHGGEYRFFAAQDGHLLQLVVPDAAAGATDAVALGYEHDRLTSFRFAPQQDTTTIKPTVGMALGDRQRAVFTWGGLAVPGGRSVAFKALNEQRGVEYTNDTGRGTQHYLTLESIDGEAEAVSTRVFGAVHSPRRRHPPNLHRGLADELAAPLRDRSERRRRA